MKACILIKTEPGKHNEVSAKVGEMPEVKLVFPTFGRTDVVANSEVRNLKELASLLSRVSGVEGVLATETLIALEV
jgi:DNA-binding Lrp family transcriptional regulator